MTRSIGGASSGLGGSHALAARRGKTSAAQNLGAVPFRTSQATKRTSGYSQADTRRPMLMYDQHGREWSCSVENRSGMPTGLITNDFSAPWLPEQAYLVVNPENPSELWIDYRRMFTDRRQAMGAFHNLAVQLCADKDWPMPAKRGEYSSNVRRVLGNPPQPLQPVKAAAQGNPWILGETDIPDPRLTDYVKPPELLELDMEDDEDYGEDGYAEAVEDTPRRGGVAMLPNSGYEARPSARPAIADSLDDFEDDDTDDEPDDFDETESEDAALARFDGDDDAGDDSEDAGDDHDAFGADASAGGDTDALLDLVDGEGAGTAQHDEALDDEHDAAGLGGKTVPAGKEERAARMAPRRPESTSKRHKKGKSRARRSQAQRGGSKTMPSLRARMEAAGAAGHAKGAKPRRSLADGARPVVGAVANEHAFTVDEA